jgi:hypothetical protein
MSPLLATKELFLSFLGSLDWSFSSAHYRLMQEADSFESILDTPCTLGDAIANAPELLTKPAERVTHSILVGQKLNA